MGGSLAKGAIMADACDGVTINLAESKVRARRVEAALPSIAYLTLPKARAPLVAPELPSLDEFYLTFPPDSVS